VTLRQQFVGVYTSPLATFERLAGIPVKHSLWIVPLAFMITVSLLSNIILKSNPAIQSVARESSIQALEQQLDQAVEKGSMTTLEKDEYVHRVRDRLSHEEPSRFVSQSLVISTTLMFNILFASGAFFVCAKYLLGGKGKFISALIAFATSLYILILQSIVIVSVSILTGTAISGTNLTALVHAHDSTIGGFLATKVDPFLLWFYSVAGIGCAKMFGSQRLMPYVYMTLLVWLGSGILLFYAAGIFPVLRWIVSL
jgi:hypothetical protein